MFVVIAYIPFDKPASIRCFLCHLQIAVFSGKVKTERKVSKKRIRSDQNNGWFMYSSVVSSRPKQPGLIGLAALSSQPGRLFDQPTTQPTQPGCGPAGKCWTVVQDSDTSRASLLYAHHSGSLINERSPGALENQKAISSSYYELYTFSPVNSHSKRGAAAVKRE
jgi:hypothetical protein